MADRAKVFVAGNPNSGKTSVFNRLTGARHSTGNYPGITVERKTGSFRVHGRSFEVTDLPGIYSITAGSDDEIIARETLLGERPDLIVNIVNAATLTRSLFLTLQLMETGIPLILVLNMWDVVQRKRLRISTERLSELLGIPVVTTVGSRGTGIDGLKEAIFQGARAPGIPWLETAPEQIRNALERTGGLLREAGEEDTAFRRISLLEGNAEPPDILAGRLERIRAGMDSEHGTEDGSALALARFSFLEELIGRVCIIGDSRSPSLTDSVDRVLLDRRFGIPIFLVMMYLVFNFTFAAGEPLMAVMEQLFSLLAGAVSGLWPAGADSPLKDLIIEGVIGGVGGVLVFLPNIVLLFLAIAILEDSGYMARVAYIMDDLMKKAGLQGKSFVPLVIGFGCTVPAILATRTLDNRGDRLTTIMIAPLMSCGARLPIYMLLIPAFFPVRWRAPLLWSIYIFGALLALLVAKQLRKRVFTGEEGHLLVELPSYHVPTPVSVFRHTWDRAGEYVKKAGTVILALSVVLWALSSYPRTDAPGRDYDAEMARLEASAIQTEAVSDSIVSLENARQAEIFGNTFAGRFGMALEPVMKPLGFDWRVVTALIGATAAKEAFVSQMGVVFAVGEADEGSVSLREKLRDNYTPLQGLAMILFSLISMPCIATLAVTRKETGSWRWALFQMVLLTALAYLITLAVYQAGLLLS